MKIAVDVFDCQGTRQSLVEADALAQWDGIKRQFEENQRLGFDLRALLRALSRLCSIRSVDVRDVVPMEISTLSQRPLPHESPAIWAIFNCRLLPHKFGPNDRVSRANTVETAWTDRDDEILSNFNDVVRKAIEAAAEAVDDDCCTGSWFTALLQGSFKSVHDLDRVPILLSAIHAQLELQLASLLPRLVKLLRLDFFRERGPVFDSCTKMFRTLRRLSLDLK